MKLALPFAILAAVLLLACQTHAAPARRAQPRQNKPEIPEVARKEAICFAYYNPTAFPAPLTNLAASASGHGLVRFNKTSRKITIECWPRAVDVTQPGAKQYAGWPITIDQLENYGRKPAARLPEVEAPAGIANPVVQVVDERSGEVVYTLRAGKGSVYEGGMHVPFVVSWPGTLPAGKDYDQPVSSVDVFATALAVAGAAMPTDKQYDSINLLPFLRGEKPGPPHDRLFWRTSTGLWATRQGASKLVRKAGSGDELYDLAADLSETKNLAQAKPEAAKQLGASVDAWNLELVPPAFPGLGARNQGKAKAKKKQDATP